MNFTAGRKPYGYLGKAKAGLGRAKPKINAGLRPAPGPKHVAAGLGPASVPASRPPSPAAPPIPTLDDARYNSDINNYQRDFNNTNLGINNREFGIQEHFGFNPEFASNPYTLANALMRNANQQFNRTTNSAARSGQLYSGATSRARDADAFSAGAAQDQARRDYNQQLAQIALERTQAQSALDSGRDSAYLDMMDRALQSEPDSGLYPDSPGSYGGKKKGQSKKSAPKGKSAPKKPPYLAKLGLRPVKKPIDPGYVKPITPAAKKKGKK